MRVCFTGCWVMNIGIVERVRVGFFLLTGLILLALLSENAFCDGSLNAGVTAGSADGTITIGGVPDFTANSGTIVLGGDAIVVSDGSGGNDIKLGNYTTDGSGSVTTDGAAIFTGGHTITGITLSAGDLDTTTGVTGAGFLTIYGGTNATSNGGVNIVGAISAATAKLKILGVSGKEVSITATAGGINMGTNDVNTKDGSNNGGSVEIKITDSSSSECITVGNIYSFSKSFSSSSSSSGAGGAVTVSTTGSGAITVGDISSNSTCDSTTDSTTSGAGGDVTVSTGGGAITIDEIRSLSTISSNHSSSGAGGNVTVSTGSGAIIVENIYSYSSGSNSSGAGGDVTVSTGSGAITVGKIYSYSYSSGSTSSGAGGNIKVSTGSGNINITDISSKSSSTGAGGDVRISITGSGDINIADEITSFSSSSGAGGDVFVSTGSGAITVGNISSFSSYDAGGTVSVSNAGSGEVRVGRIKAYGGTSGGNVEVLVANGVISALGYIRTNGTVTINAGELAGDIGSIGNASQSYYKTGQVDITIDSVTGGTRAIGDITTNNADVNITAKSATNALTLGDIDAGSGDVNITAVNSLTLSNSFDAANSRINLNTGSGTLTFKGATTTNTLNLTVGSTGTFNSEAGVDTTLDIANLSGSINQNSASNLTLTTLNTFAGEAGILKTTAGGLSITNNIDVLAGSTLKLDAHTANSIVLSGEVNLQDGATLENAGAEEEISTVTLASSATGILKTTNGVLTVANSIDVLSGSTFKLDAHTANSISLSGGVNLQDGATLENAGANEEISTVTVASGATGILKTTAGVLTVVNNIDVLSGSTFKLDAHTANSISLSGGVNLQDGATLENAGANEEISTVTVASGATGILKTTAGVLTVANNIDIVAGSTLKLDAHTTDSIFLNGGVNLQDGATLDSIGADKTISSLTVAGSSTGRLNVTSGTLTLLSVTNSGTLDMQISKGATFANATGSAIDLSGGKGTLTLDFGDESATSIYAKTTGAFKSSGTTEVTSIYGINGFAGTTYANVFDTQVVDETDTAYADGIELNNTKDRYRKYILTNTGTGITVENSNFISQDIIDLGGSQQAADAANNLIDNQGNFDSEGQEFVDQFTALSGHNLLRGSRELIGEEATAATIQSELHSITAAIGAVRNQMAAFRMGSVASGLASSFSSAGSTAATSDMADADELSAAYEAAGSSFTTDNTVYHQTTVWANAFGGFGEQGTNGDTTGYDFWNAGTMVGLDYAFAEELRVGGLLGYSYNRANLYEDSGDSIDNALRLGGYASYNWDNFFVDISPSMGIHIIESNRKLITNGLTAKGERTGLDFNINGSIGYTFNLPYDIDFTPSYSLGYTLFYDPDYTETGAGAGNLSYKSFNSNSLLQDTGVKFGKLFRVSDKLAFLPEVWGGLEVEYLNTGGNRSSTTSTSIGGSSYSTSMSSLETYRGYWGAGITALVNDNVSVFGRYDHKIWHKGYNAGFSAGIKIVF